MTPARSALATALGLYAVAVAVAIIAVPWDAAVAPWADLALGELQRFTAEQVAAIDAYVDAAWLPGILGWLAGPAAALLVMAVAPLRRAIIGLGPSRPPILRDLIVAAGVLVIVRLAALPFALWSAQVRRDAGLLIEPWSTWWWRWLGESAASVVIGAVALAIALAILRRWPRHGWWAIVTGAMLATLALTAVIPILQRLEGTAADPVLTARVLQIADRAGVEVGQVTVIEVADRSPAINANVSGWGPTRTVTVYDTVGSTASPAEVDALIAHELIHVRDGDAVLGAVLAALTAGGTVALVIALASAPRVRRRLGATSPGDVAVIPLAIAVVLAASVVGTIAGATISRPLESRADREAVALTGDPDAYADLIERLAVTNRSTLTPPRWRYALLFTHPTPLQRLAADQGATPAARP